MSFRCETCNKSSKKAANRSHSKIKTLRRQYPNLQKHNGKKMCTRCIKTESKPPRAVNPKKVTAAA